MKIPTLTQTRRERRKERQQKEAKKVIATRVVDYGTMKTVRIDDKTYLWIMSDSDAEKAIKKYYMNRSKYLKKFSLLGH